MMNALSIAFILNKMVLIKTPITPELTAIAMSGIELKLAHVLVSIWPQEHTLSELEIVLDLAIIDSPALVVKMRWLYQTHAFTRLFAGLGTCPRHFGQALLEVDKVIFIADLLSVCKRL